jgi:transposase
VLNIEIRKKIIESHKSGNSVKETCRIMLAKKSAVYNLLKQEKESGDISPRTGFNGRKPSMDSEAMENLKNLFLEQNDLTLEETIEKLNLLIKKIKA